jgi:hypothetical protein
MTITFPDTNDHQTTPDDTPAQTEPIDITAAQILIDLSSPSSTTSQGTPPLGDQLQSSTPIPRPISLFATGLSVPELCSNRTGLSDFANNYLDSSVEERIQIILKSVRYILSSTPRLRPRASTCSASAQHLKLARRALLSTVKNPPHHPQLRSYRDALESRPKQPTPTPRQLVPLGRPRPKAAPSSPGPPPPIPHHSRPLPAGSPPIGFDSLTRKQLIDLLREVLKFDPLAFGTPQFSSPRHRRRAFRGNSTTAAQNSRAYSKSSTPTQLHHRSPLISQSHAFSAAHPRRRRLQQRARRQ